MANWDELGRAKRASWAEAGARQRWQRHRRRRSSLVASRWSVAMDNRRRRRRRRRRGRRGRRGRRDAIGGSVAFDHPLLDS